VLSLASFQREKGDVSQLLTKRMIQGWALLEVCESSQCSSNPPLVRDKQGQVREIEGNLFTTLPLLVNKIHCCGCVETLCVAFSFYETPPAAASSLSVPPAAALPPPVAASSLSKVHSYIQ